MSGTFTENKYVPAAGGAARGGLVKRWGSVCMGSLLQQEPPQAVWALAIPYPLLACEQALFNGPKPLAV